GQSYQWSPGLSIYEVEPAELPPAVVERLRATAARPPVDPATDDGNIPEGKRNAELFKLACALAKARILDASLETMLQAENQARCKPPLPAAEVASIAKSALAQRTQRTQRTQTHAQILLGMALADSELWHTPDDVAYA